MKIIFLGAPGVGKGTQAAIISKKLGIPSIATGNILREAVKEGTELGLAAKGIMESGGLVPDDIIIGIIRDRVTHSDCAEGYILDGMPRTLPQAEALDEYGLEADIVLSFEMPDELIKERLVGRRTCKQCSSTFHVTGNPPKNEGVCDSCGGELIQRDDDKPETVESRFKVFHENTAPLLDYYRSQGKLRTVDANDTLERTTQKVLAALEQV